MRNLKWLALAVFLAVPVGVPANAATLNPGIGPSVSDLVIDVAVKCGPRAHYVKGYRAKHGGWVKGRCVRDRPRR